MTDTNARGCSAGRDGGAGRDAGVSGDGAEVREVREVKCGRFSFVEVLNTDVFNLQKVTAAIPLYHYTLKPHVKAEAAELALLTESLKLICDAKNQKSGVVLDCSALRGMDAMRRLMELNLFKTAKGIGHSGIAQFVLVTDQEALRQVAKAIISLRSAAAYTRVEASSDAALQLFFS